MCGESNHEQESSEADPDGRYPYLTIEGERHPIKAFVNGLGIESGAERQLRNTANLPFIHKWIAAMPDVHWGLGATVGSVIPTHKAIIPAAVGVDIGCGMMAVKTSLKGQDLPKKLKQVRRAIEKAVPHGTGRGHTGCFKDPSNRILNVWKELERGLRPLADRYPGIMTKRPHKQLGTLGSGNHFVEVCLDKSSDVWVMLHSGSRGIGNRIGMHFIAKARKDMEKAGMNLPDRDLAYFEEGSENFADYVHAVNWAQDYARRNRQCMMENILAALRRVPGMPKFKANLEAINCHHNYVAKEHHYGEDVYVTRKGAVRAGEGELGIIPGSMGARSYIVRGKGNKESFESCSHGAGRLMSRSQARKQFTLDDHIKATQGVECRKDRGVLDETPGAYKPIDKVMAAQKDLVEVVYELRQIVCVKGS